MKNKVKYTTNRNYRDFSFEEDEPNAKIVNKLKERKKSFLQKFKNTIKSIFSK
jgi:hypothetical protein